MFLGKIHHFQVCKDFASPIVMHSFSSLEMWPSWSTCHRSWLKPSQELWKCSQSTAKINTHMTSYAFKIYPRSGYAFRPRWSAADCFNDTWIFIRLRHKMLLWACLTFVDLETFEGFPMKSSSCWHAVANGERIHSHLDDKRSSLRAVWHSMCDFG